MDNSIEDLTPRLEALAQLYELRDRYGIGVASALSGPCSPRQQHALETGHLLSAGCCRDVSVAHTASD